MIISPDIQDAVASGWQLLQQSLSHLAQGVVGIWQWICQYKPW